MRVSFFSKTTRAYTTTTQTRLRL
uniref:Uncharacterized protein n=1 Tax=Amphimedon queenslandica TaxID=400682 RepID=A0A1X7ULC8_AMPQE